MNYRSEIKAFARKSLFANYGAVLGTYLFSAAPGIVLFSITMFFSVISAVFLNLDSYSIFTELAFYGSTMLNQIFSMLYELFTYLLLPFTSVGIAAYMLLLIRGDRKKFTFPYAFGWKRYAPFLGGCLLVNLLTFLWMLLFIIPGIVKGYAYSFTPYILADCPHLSPTSAIGLSKKMTDGVKRDLFMLELSFIGWWILAVFTCGLSLIYSYPYYLLSRATLYESIKENALLTGKITHLEYYGYESNSEN